MGTAISCTVEAALKQPCLQAAFLCSKTITIIIICVVNVQTDDCMHECTEAVVAPEVLIIIRANLSEINTSVTSLHICVYMLIGLDRPLTLTANKHCDS